mmetsp:Transcript_73258/g.162679  ORF Transcript_73258/g.162679 Transcript_73258/m.162679 type:complete len:131 (-) Transcript_73258:1938-2330(-)
MKLTRDGLNGRLLGDRPSGDPASEPECLLRVGEAATESAYLLRACVPAAAGDSSDRLALWQMPACALARLLSSSFSGLRRRSGDGSFVWSELPRRRRVLMAGALLAWDLSFLCDLSRLALLQLLHSPNEE